MLKGVSSFGPRNQEMAHLTSKDKRYSQQVEKLLSTFDSLDEWADYIAFLSKIQKTLQLNEDPKLAHTVTWIPHATQVANKLALCLSSRLPNGVHQKTLSIYNSIFNALTSEVFNNELQIWLPGILPLMSFCSTQVKPQLIKIYQNHILSGVHATNLRIILRPLILSLLSGLEDENSETFSDVLQLMDDLKQKSNDDGYFWQSMFICIIANPERRLGALCWCNKRLPSFASIKTDNSSKISDEAAACLSPESGLLIRAFSTSINLTTTFNSANDIIVVRGFLDLLTSHLSLDSSVLNEVVSPKDKELLIIACCRVTLKKDMSLNRRLWGWLLGPDIESQPSEPNKRISRSHYFKTYGLEPLTSGLLKMINSSNTQTKKDAFHISLALIMDKWEISHLITPQLFSSIIFTCYENKEDSELLSLAQSFFDGVEASYIWSDIISMIFDYDEKKLDLLQFTLRSFNYNEEEMVLSHVPLAILAILMNTNVTSKWLEILEVIVSLVPPNAFHAIEIIPNLDSYPYENLKKSIKSYYLSLINDEDTEPPLSRSDLSYLILELLKNVFIKYMSEPDFSCKLCKIFCEMLYIIPDGETKMWIKKDLSNAILNQNTTSQASSNEEKQKNLLVAFSITKIFNAISRSLAAHDKNKILKIILSNLWPALISCCPTNHQVEAVKVIFDLEISCPTHHIEAGILNLLLESSPLERVRALSCLWVHSSSFNEGDSLMMRPLLLVLDDLHENDSHRSLCAVDFIRSVQKSGSVNRLLKLITSPTLNFEFMQAEICVLNSDADLGQFLYYLRTILNVINTDTKHMKELLNNELAVMDSTSKLNLIKSNKWDISTYKSLIFCIIEKFFNLRLSPEIEVDQGSLEDYYDCINTCLKLLSILLTGNESDFNEKFHLLISSCSYYFTLSKKKAFDIELIEAKFLNCILHFLKISEDLRINLNLLHIEENEKMPLIVNFIVQGIENSQSSILLESWINLLTRSLYLFNESVFSVIIILNDSLIHKINEYFKEIQSHEFNSEIVDIESSINTLISGLEDLLSISHSFLLNSNIRAQGDRQNNNADSGFFGNVIQGVFQIESPAIRNSEQNKRYSILLSFQDAVKACYKIWAWADTKPQPDGSTFVSEKSLAYLATKLKFRTKRFLEALMELERREVVETLIKIDNASSTSIKLLNVLDGGRSQITLPHMFNSITSRCYPSILDESQKSSLNVPLSAKDISAFLVLYFESIDNDTVSDIWAFVMSFFKSINAHTNHFNATLPDMLKVLKCLSIKLNSSKFGEQKRNRKELSDLFSKVLSSTLNNKSNALPKESGEEESVNEFTGNDLPAASENDVIESLIEIIPYFSEIFQDDDKWSNSITSIMTHLVYPHVKSKLVHEISIQVLGLIDHIGKQFPNKSWKSLVFELFMDNSFFNMNSSKSNLWASIIVTWTSIDKDRMNELVARVTPLISSSPSNIFVWNESSETENKIFTLKRISYLIIIQKQDFYLNNLDDLFTRIEYSLNTSCPTSYRSEIAVLLRAIALNFSELHLLPHWTVISHELLSIFSLILSKGPKELDSSSQDEVNLILNGSKLLDQLLLLGYDEFNLNEWLFISSHSGVSEEKSTGNLFSIIDAISEADVLNNPRDLPVKVETPDDNMKPLLYGVSSITSIKSLRLFFDSLSLINYERIYGLYKVDFVACRSDLTLDIMS